MAHLIHRESRRRHAERVALGLLPTALRLPSVSQPERKAFIDTVVARGLSDELAAILEEEQAVDAAGACDLRDEDPIQAEVCRRRTRAWRSAQRVLATRRSRRSARSRVISSPWQKGSPGRARAITGSDSVATTTLPVEAALTELTTQIRALRAEVEAMRQRLRLSEKAVLTLDEAAEYLGLSRRSVERRIATKDIQATKLCWGDQGSVRVLRSKLDEYLESRTR